MPFVFSHVEYCDMHFVYGFCDGDANAAVEEYRRRYPERRIPSRGVFTRVQQTLRDNGCLPSVKDFLNESFPNRWLGRRGTIPWPPRSSDLTSLDYYLWGHMKTLVYETKVD